MGITGKVAAVAIVATALVAPAANAAPPMAPEKPTTPAAQLLLTQGEFPAGYTVQPVPRAELDKVLGDVGAGVSSARITPAQCRGNAGSTDLAKVSQVPLAVAVNKQAKSALSEALTDAKNPKSSVTPRKGCETIHIDMDGLRGSTDKLSLDITTTVTQVPGAPAGAKVAAMRTLGTVTVDGKPVKVDQEQLVGVNTVRGYAVIVSASTTGQGAQVDRGAFAKTLTAASNKVRTAK